MPQPTKQEEFSKSLRALADWYDQHPKAPVSDNRTVLQARFDPKDLATIPVEAKEEIYISSRNVGLYFRVVEFDEFFTVKFYTGLASVCEEKVVETKTVDIKAWVVRPEFARAESPQDEPEAKIAG